MKHLISLISLSSFLITAPIIRAQRAWDIMDTLSIRNVGPGVKYTQVFLPAVPVNAYIMEVDLNNPYISIETMQAFDQVGKTEKLTKASDRMSFESHNCLGGINGNFWIVPVQNYPAPLNGMPHSGSMRNGEMVSDPNNWNRGWTNNPEELLEEIGFAMLDEQRTLWVDDVLFNAEVKIPDKGSYKIDNVNRIRYNNQIVFFNSYVGAKTRASEVEGIEVFIKPKANQNWGTSQDILCEVTRIVGGKGEVMIEEGESVLSGAGSGAIFLSELKSGSDVIVNMGLNTRRDQTPVKALQMLTGNALVMKNGRLTIRNYHEEYNSMVYPRTGIGKSDDGKTAYLIVMDRKTPSRGASTEVMCEILRKAGATSVCSLDGGGSAQMMIDAEIVNYPGDGSERAVANGWMLFHNAPKDDVVTKIDFADNETILPRNSVYTPIILGYNQYGVLIDKDFKDYRLSCSSELGIIRDNTLVVNGTNGLLNAEYGNSKISRTIKSDDSKISFNRDTLIIDKYHSIPLSIYAVSKEKTYPVDLTSVKLQFADPFVCTIESGKFVALNNGETYLYASLDQISDTLKVKVQTPADHMLDMIQMSNLDDWKIESSSNLKNPISALSASGLNYRYTYTAGRNPFIRIKPLKSIYGLPDTINFILNSGEMAFSKLNISISTANGINKTFGYADIVKNEDYSISIPVTSLLEDINDYTAYPLSVDYIQGYLRISEMEENKDYMLNLKSLASIYNGISTPISTVNTHKSIRLASNLIKDNRIVLLCDLREQVEIDVKLYTISGMALYENKVSLVDNFNVIEIPELHQGVYILNITEKGRSMPFRILIP